MLRLIKNIEQTFISFSKNIKFIEKQNTKINFCIYDKNRNHTKRTNLVYKIKFITK